MHLVITQEELQTIVTTFLNLPLETTVDVQLSDTEMPILISEDTKQPKVSKPVQPLVDLMHDAPVKSANKQSRSRSRKPANSAKNMTNNKSDVLTASQKSDDNTDPSTLNINDLCPEITMELVEIKKENPPIEIVGDVTSEDVIKTLTSETSPKAFGNLIKSRFEARENTEEKKPDEPAKDEVAKIVPKTKSIFDAMDSKDECEIKPIRDCVTAKISEGIFSHEVKERESDSVKPNTVKSLFN